MQQASSLPGPVLRPDHCGGLLPWPGLTTMLSVLLTCRLLEVEVSKREIRSSFKGMGWEILMT